MPEYLAPGVYVEETSFRSRSIEGVSTSTSAFVGPTATGPVGGEPDLLTSYADFERTYGGPTPLALASDDLLARNYVAHAARAYFDNGGSRLYVVRVFRANAGGPGVASARATPVLGADPTPSAWLTGRFPGSALNGAVVTLRQSAMPTAPAGLASAPDGSVARIHTAAAEGADPVAPALWVKQDGLWRSVGEGGVIADVPAANVSGVTEAYLLTFSVDVSKGNSSLFSAEGLAAGEDHPRFIGAVLAENPVRRADFLANPVALHFEPGAAPSGIDLTTGLFGAQPATRADRRYQEPVRTFTLVGGDDGALPSNSDYADQGFASLQALEDVSIVAAPGYSARIDADRSGYLAIQDALISHVSRRRAYRIAVLDAPPGQTPSTMRDLRGLIDSTRAALYYPWVTVIDPLSPPGQVVEIDLPPSGFVSGIYARTDVERGVWKAPANEIVRGAVRFERTVNFAEQELLNPIGVNCLRLLPGRGYRVWGARTPSSDPEWRYLSVRRYFNYLEASIDNGTQWAVFEPNGDLLWASVRGAVSDFLYSEWRNGALLGTKPEDAFFVRCDRSTMTQNDLDNGRLICLIGVAVVKPAEFVIFRIGQKTAEAKN
jgi:phage tail sheath protein FI